MAERYRCQRLRHGGSRPGNPRGIRGGHRKGKITRLSKELIEAAAKTGELPHEFMLRVMRAAPGDKIAGHKITWEDRKWAASQAANYFAPKLLSSKVSGSHTVDMPQLDGQQSAIDALKARLDKLVVPTIETVH